MDILTIQLVIAGFLPWPMSSVTRKPHSVPSTDVSGEASASWTLATWSQQGKGSHIQPGDPDVQFRLVGLVVKFSDFQWPVALHPGRLTAGSPTNHPFRKENDLNQTSMIMFHANLQGCKHGSRKFNPWKFGDSGCGNHHFQMIPIGNHHFQLPC